MDIRELMIGLDMALTSKSRHEAEHTARTQGDFGLLGERIYYLSDGGYSRVVISDAEWPRVHLFVASESLGQVKKAWKRDDVQRLVAAIEATISASVENL